MSYAPLWSKGEDDVELVKTLNINLINKDPNHKLT